MKTKKLFTSLAAAVMLSAGLAGTGMAMGQPVHAAGTTQSSNTKTGTVSVKRRTVSATVNSDNPKLVVVAKDQANPDQIDSNYTKGQTINVLWSTEAKQGDKTVTLYYIENRTINGKDSFVFIPSTDVTTSGNVPTESAFVEQANNDVKAIQDAYNKRSLQYVITVTPKSKKGAKIYYAYKKSKKSKKITFAASKKTIKYGKKYKSSMIVKNGKTRYVYIGKKRYVKQSALKIVSAKYAPLNLPDDLKNLIVEN